MIICKSLHNCIATNSRNQERYILLRLPVYMCACVHKFLYIHYATYNILVISFHYFCRPVCTDSFCYKCCLNFRQEFVVLFLVIDLDS